MTRLLLVGTGLVITVGLAPAQDIKADDRVPVRVLLATEHVPKDLDPDTRVNLKMVTGKTVAKGQTIYKTELVVADVEVLSVTTYYKPVTPEAAVWVKVLVPKDMVEKVEKTTRDQMVMVLQQMSGVKIEPNKKKPVTLRLEMARPDEKVPVLPLLPAWNLKGPR